MAAQSQAATLEEIKQEIDTLAEVDAEAEIFGRIAKSVGKAVATKLVKDRIKDAMTCSTSTSSCCYAYGSIILRNVNGQTEAVPIEAVKEGDQLLAKSASGLHFTPAVAVDLHPDKLHVLTLSTRSGHQVTLTPSHMVPVHSEGKEELLPARDVKVGSHLTIVNDAGATELSDVIDVSAAEAPRGVANILTGPETLVVNGVVGSVHAETTFKGAAGVVRKAVLFANDIAGARAARYVYRTGEMIHDCFAM